jgi:hypothetical protein
MTAVRPEHRHRTVRPVPDVEQECGEDLLTVRCQVRFVGGEAGRALATGQGRALAALLASLGEVEV